MLLICRLEKAFNLVPRDFCYEKLLNLVHIVVQECLKSSHSNSSLSD